MATCERLDGSARSLAASLPLLTARTTTGHLAQCCGYDRPPAPWALLEHLDARGSPRVSDIAAGVQSTR